jgi:DNA polymerase-4
METTATILHADLDAFYASVEQLLDPSLRGKPIAVGGGVVLAASYEAARVRRARRHAGAQGARTLPAADLRRRQFQPLPAAWRRRDQGARRLHPGGRAHFHRRGLRRRRRLHPSVRLAGRDRDGHPPPRATELGLPISIGVARTKHLAKIASQVAKPDGLVVVEPGTEIAFLHDLPVGLMWGVGPATRARLLEIGIETIGQLARTHSGALTRLLGPAAGDKLSALAWNRDPRKLQTHRRAHSAGAQSALGRSPRVAEIIVPTLLHLADRVASRLRAKARPGRTVTVRVRFADLRAVTRSITLDQPISATAMLAEIATDLVRGVLAEHPPGEDDLAAGDLGLASGGKRLQLDLPLGLADEKRRPGSGKGLARVGADRAIDKIRQRFGKDAVGYGAVALDARRSVPDEFRELAEKEL